jgi:hypothetical protein
MAIDLQDDIAFHRANWRAERIGWGLILAIILAGVFGLTGRGPLGTTTVGDTTLMVNYDRVMRNDAPGKARIRIGPPITNDTVVHLWVSRTILATCSLQRVVPLPLRTISMSDRTTFDFRVEPGSDSMIVVLDCMPRSTGRYHGMIGVDGGPSIQLSNIVLP